MENLTPTSAINSLALEIIGGAYLLIFSLLLIVWNRIEKTRKELGHKIEKAVKDINAVADKNKRHQEVCDDRLDVLDRVASAATDDEFSSKQVALGQQEPPSTTRLRKLLHFTDPTHPKGTA